MDRRRDRQREHNREHGITPRSIIKSIEEVRLSTRVADARVEQASKEASVGAADLRDPVKRAAAIDALEQQMKEAAANLEFEVAAMLRDQVIELRAIGGPNLDRGTPRDRQRA